MKPIFTSRLSLALCAMVAACAPAGPQGSVDASRQEAVARDPAALLRIGAAAEQAGDIDSAGAFYRRAADLRPGSAMVQLGLARSLAEQGETGKAIEALQAARAADPSNPALAATLGRMLVLAHRPEAALVVFRDGLAQAPGLPSLLIGQGVALDAVGQHGEAQDSYRQVLAHDPDSVAARNDMALSLALSGRKDESVVLLQRVLPASEGFSRGTVTDNLSLVLGLSDDRSAALAPRAPVLRRNLAQGGTIAFAPGSGAGAAGAGEKAPGLPTPLGPNPPVPPPPLAPLEPEPLSPVTPALGSAAPR